MMDIKEIKNGTNLTLMLTGRLDLNTAPQLESIVKALPEDVAELVLDFEGLEYISSAGLRVLLAAQKRMKTQGRMVIRHVGDMIREVFDITGFCEILNIE